MYIRERGCFSDTLPYFTKEKLDITDNINDIESDSFKWIFSNVTKIFSEPYNNKNNSGQDIWTINNTQNYISGTIDNKIRLIELNSQYNEPTITIKNNFAYDNKPFRGIELQINNIDTNYNYLLQYKFIDDNNWSTLSYTWKK